MGSDKIDMENDPTNYASNLTSQSNSDSALEEVGYYAPNGKIIGAHSNTDKDTTATCESGAFSDSTAQTIKLYFCMLIALILSLATFLLLTLLAKMYVVLCFSYVFF